MERFYFSPKTLSQPLMIYLDKQKTFDTKAHNTDFSTLPKASAYTHLQLHESLLGTYKRNTLYHYTIYLIL